MEAGPHQVQVASYLVSRKGTNNRLGLVIYWWWGGKRKDSAPEGLCHGNMESRVTKEGSIGGRGGKNSAIIILVTPSCCCPGAAGKRRPW